MALLRIPEEKKAVSDPKDITNYLASVGIIYERWEASVPVTDDAPSDEILSAYATAIERLKAEGGYAIADVIDVKPQTPGLDSMLARFNREHWHDEDEVRFIVRGRGIFHIHPQSGPVIAVEVEAGDLIRVPRGTWHWFDLCAEREIRAIRLFQNTTGWTPHYTESGADKNFQPVCFGPAYLPPRVVTSQSEAQAG